MDKNSYALLTVLFVVILSAMAEFDIRKITAGARKKCIAETGISVEILDDAEIGRLSDPKLPCYFACIMEKFNMFTKDGKVNIRVLEMSIPDMWKEVAMDVLDACRNVTGKNKCDLAYNVNKCAYEANPLAYFVP